MLKDNFYHITAESAGEYTITFDAQHAIFKAHFPGKPIVPGACLVQMAQEMASLWLQKTIIFTQIDNLKFLKLVTPDVAPTFQFEAKEDNKIRVSVMANAINYANFTATYMCTDSDL